MWRRCGRIDSGMAAAWFCRQRAPFRGTAVTDDGRDGILLALSDDVPDGFQVSSVRLSDLRPTAVRRSWSGG